MMCLEDKTPPDGHVSFPLPTLVPTGNFSLELSPSFLCRGFPSL